ncbi:DNA replication/repair protein RecF [candidate division KSB3 bacterium]|uniref:DNA replication and repair protein RecF n=1 Tax=candidate division KSB3 bacterium TaxID=2044937 RepID=A0A9D5JXM2_9BACT|nr:DNA replication/repair protein RecF [candidate division KSB3 bacterium]MBD3326192.1 DNA replication/repair protein RecF [candidate division KSB3 bacterium]
MYLKAIEVSHFRSFAARQFELSSGLNVLLGPNASGKTNLLEAIHVLSNLRSFRTPALKELIQWGTSEGFLRGEVHAAERVASGFSKTTTLAVGIKPHTRIPLINSKPCRSSKDYLPLLPTTTFVPDDLSLVKGAPASRRYFLDRGTFLFYPSYWGMLTDYNRLLQQKNALLRKRLAKEKDGSETGLDASGKESFTVWNAQLQILGSQIILRRMQFLQRLQRYVKTIYAQWLGSRETLDLHYKSSIGSVSEIVGVGSNVEGWEHEDIYQSIQQLYDQAIHRIAAREYRVGTTLVGAHRDDIDIKLSGKSLRSYGSQGQQRTAVLALKLAEVSLYFEQYAEYPVLLLDDVTSELDEQRNMALFEYLDSGMQVFISTTHALDLSPVNAVPVACIDLSKDES